jgi:uncharacterized caspase-like protein
VGETGSKQRGVSRALMLLLLLPGLLILLLLASAWWQKAWVNVEGENAIRSQVTAGGIAPVGPAAPQHASPTPTGTLFVVAIGNDRFVEPSKYELRYAESDAAKVGRFLSAGTEGLFANSSIHTLVGSDATHAHIAETFESLVRTVRPEDMVVVSFAGIDKTVRRRVGAERHTETVLLAHDFDPDGLDKPALTLDAPGTIPLRVLAAWLSRMQARKRIVVLDTGGTREHLRSFQELMTERDALLGEASARSLLVVGLDGNASESPKVGGGLLAAALLRGLSGDADLGPDLDGLVSAHELEAALPRLYFEVMREVGSAQAGRLRTLAVGADFLVANAGQERGGFHVPARAPPAPPASKRRDHAILFATDEYDDAQWSRLRNPIHDARTIRKELETRYGFDVTLVENPRFADMRDHLARLQAASFGPKDQLLVFVAGHGTYDELTREGYVIARDSGPGPVPGLAISNSQLRTAVDAIPCEHILVVMDTCFGGTFDQRVSDSTHRGNTAYDDIKTDKLIKRLLGYHARLYLTSGGKEYVPDGRPGRHSPFAFKLLEGLRGGAGRADLVTWTDLKGHVRALKTEPRAGTFGNCDPGADFVFRIR